jgi:hypothetical protein
MRKHEIAIIAIVVLGVVVRFSGLASETLSAYVFGVGEWG